MLRMNPIVLGLAVGALVAAGCGSPYVNIPAQVGDVATHNPNDLSKLSELWLEHICGAYGDDDQSGGVDVAARGRSDLFWV